LTLFSAPADDGPMLYWIGPPGAAGDALSAEFERKAQAAVERIESNPWIHVWRLVNAKVERTGDRSLIDMCVRLFKAWEASQYS
jgi:hypothetical protein